MARFLLYEVGYPGSVASSLGALRDALSAADAAAAVIAAGARLGRLIADLELQRRSPDSAATFNDARAGTG